jgi:hypothetical protein
MQRKNKKGDMTIQYAFLIFLATITVFVVIGLITKWSFSTNTLICKLSGECNQPTTPADIQKINATSCPDFLSEIVKGARLCNENGKLGRLSGSEPVCYIIIGPCTSITKQEINNSLTAPAINLTNFEITFDRSNKAAISYEYTRKIVKID